MAETLLAVSGITKRFGGLSALNSVSMSVARGEIFGLIGPNGAGKTTLFNILTGVYHPDGGEFVFAGRRLSGLQSHQVAEAGIARTFQNIRLFANMTALENVMVGRHVRTRAGVLGAILRNRAIRLEESAIEKRANELLDYCGIARHANELARNLAYGDQRRLEIARALATDPKLLALDEPADSARSKGHGAPAGGDHGAPKDAHGASKDAHGGAAKGGVPQKKALPSDKDSRFEKSYMDLDEKKALVANVAGSRKVMQVNLSLMTTYDDRVFKNVEKHRAALRSGALDVLRLTTEADLTRAEFRAELAVRLREKINSELERLENFGGIEEVFFTEFVFQ